MKQALTFTPPILSSTESKLNVEAFDASVEAFENHEYLKSFYALLDYINGDFRTKYGNVQGNEFHIPHGSIIVNIKLDEENSVSPLLLSLFLKKGGYPYSVRWQDSISTPWIWQRSICGITAFRLNTAVRSN